jgi:hypothetical protein
LDISDIVICKNRKCNYRRLYDYFHFCPICGVAIVRVKPLPPPDPTHRNIDVDPSKLDKVLGSPKTMDDLGVYYRPKNTRRHQPASEFNYDKNR